VASSHGYLNQDEYTLSFGLPQRPSPGTELRFDVSVDFPGLPSDGLWRVDKHVNSALGGIDLGTLTDREIVVNRSGRVVIQGVGYDPVAGASPRLTTTTGGLALPGAAPLPDPTPATDPDTFAGLAFDTLSTTTPLDVREIVLDGQLAPAVDCGAGAYNVALWDVTDDVPFVVPGGLLAETTSDRNRRSYFTTDIELAPQRAYRLVARVASYRTSPVAAPVEQDGVTVEGGVLYTAPACSSSDPGAARVDTAGVPLAFRFAPTPSESCLNRPPSVCDDGNACTDDTCSSAGSCVHTNNTAACDDGNACTSGDRCAGGICVGVASNCDDGNVCTTDACDPATGCTHANNTAPCNDGNVCTTVDVCTGGICAGTVPRACDDGNPCTDDTCNPLTGCVFTPDDANTCSDGNLCTSADHCVAGACVGAATNCDDGVSCTTDACIPSFGCTHTKYDVSTGDGARLAFLGSGVGESCLVDNQSGTSATVPLSPATGAMFWYLVRARNNACGVGTYGFGYQRPSPSAERILTVCP
jgi:hypothetical protein